jgi:hypothetical protein
MLPWIIQSGVISFILIFLIHYLFTFFKNNLTVPKVIDLVNRPTEQYANLMKNENNKAPIIHNTNTVNKPDINSMKDELKNYLKDLKGKNSTNTNILSSDMMGSSQYSLY